MYLCSKLFFRQATCVTVVELNILVSPYAIIFTVMDDQEPVNKIVPRNVSQLEIIRNHRNQSTLIAIIVGCAVGVLTSSQTGLITWLMGFCATAGVSWLMYEQFVNPVNRNRSSLKMSHSLYRERSTILIAILKAHGVMNYDNIKDQSQFLDKALVPTLQQMVQEGVVDEELDLENGQWRYKLSTDYVVIQTRLSIGKDLNQRMRDLEKQE